MESHPIDEVELPSHESPQDYIPHSQQYVNVINLQLNCEKTSAKYGQPNFNIN
jgi:hypothetical protein